jgi:hypothetical protein
VIALAYGGNDRHIFFFPCQVPTLVWESGTPLSRKLALPGGHLSLVDSIPRQNSVNFFPLHEKRVAPPHSTQNLWRTLTFIYHNYTFIYHNYIDREVNPGHKT